MTPDVRPGDWPPLLRGNYVSAGNDWMTSGRGLDRNFLFRRAAHADMDGLAVHSGMYDYSVAGGRAVDRSLNSRNLATSAADLYSRGACERRQGQNYKGRGGGLSEQQVHSSSTGSRTRKRIGGASIELACGTTRFQLEVISLQIDEVGVGHGRSEIEMMVVAERFEPTELLMKRAPWRAPQDEAAVPSRVIVILIHLPFTLVRIEKLHI